MNKLQTLYNRLARLTFGGFLTACLLTSCEGSFDWVYDNPSPDETEHPVAGQFYLDASDWKTWYYLDLPTAVAAQQDDSTHALSADIVAYAIPMEPLGDVETERGTHQRPGQYRYYFDVFNEGISNNHFDRFTPTASQPQPESWTVAFHRNNVRTNGCGVYETQLTDIEQVTPQLCASVTAWTADEWTENEVWDDQSTMLSCYVPSQGIAINRVLSSWLRMEIPPMPPAFVHNPHVMLLRLPDGSYAALRLVDYLSPTNKKCCLTIQYKYPIR